MELGCFMYAKFQLRETVRTNCRPPVVPRRGAFSKPLTTKISLNSAHWWLSRCFLRGRKEVCQNYKIMTKMPSK